MKKFKRFISLICIWVLLISCGANDVGTFQFNDNEHFILNTSTGEVWLYDSKYREYFFNTKLESPDED